VRANCEGHGCLVGRRIIGGKPRKAQGSDGMSRSGGDLRSENRMVGSRCLRSISRRVAGIWFSWFIWFVRFIWFVWFSEPVKQDKPGRPVRLPLNRPPLPTRLPHPSLNNFGSRQNNLSPLSLLPDILSSSGNLAPFFVVSFGKTFKTLSLCH
jgi:hypothetical protein